jgi:hypothetical protein
MMIRFQIPVARSSKKRGYDGGSKTLFRVTKNLTTPCIRVNISYRIWMFGMLAKGKKGRAGKKEFGSVVGRLNPRIFGSRFLALCACGHVAAYSGVFDRYAGMRHA